MKLKERGCTLKDYQAPTLDLQDIDGWHKRNSEVKKALEKIVKKQKKIKEAQNQLLSDINSLI